jgi:hypothetical protein
VTDNAMTAIEVFPGNWGVVEGDAIVVMHLRSNAEALRWIDSHGSDEHLGTGNSTLRLQPETP